EQQRNKSSLFASSSEGSNKDINEKQFDHELTTSIERIPTPIISQEIFDQPNDSLESLSKFDEFAKKSTELTAKIQNEINKLKVMTTFNQTDEWGNPFNVPTNATHILKEHKIPLFYEDDEKDPTEWLQDLIKVLQLVELDKKLQRKVFSTRINTLTEAYKKAKEAKTMLTYNDFTTSINVILDDEMENVDERRIKRKNNSPIKTDHSTLITHLDMINDHLGRTEINNCQLGKIFKTIEKTKHSETTRTIRYLDNTILRAAQRTYLNLEQESEDSIVAESSDESKIEESDEESKDNSIMTL
ncbi:13116_t:CDS:2, partial [Ambispora gerdemannii]